MDVTQSTYHGLPLKALTGEAWIDRGHSITLLQEKLQDLIARALGLMTRTHQCNMAHSPQEIGEPLIGLDQHELSPNREYAFRKTPSHLGEIHWRSLPQP